MQVELLEVTQLLLVDQEEELEPLVEQDQQEHKVLVDLVDLADQEEQVDLVEQL
jgi:hypothetical protein